MDFKKVSRCTVGGIDGYPVTIHVGDVIEVVYIQCVTNSCSFPSSCWDADCSGTITEIAKYENGLYHISIKRENKPPRIDSEQEFCTSNKDYGWHRLFRVISRKDDKVK